MNLANLRGAFARNKTALAVLGAVAVAGLALVARKRGGAAGTGADVAATTGSSGSRLPSSPYGASSQSYALAPYDSSASDVYNVLQPQIEALQNRIPINGSLTEPSPAPTPAETSPWAGTWLASETDPRRLQIAEYYRDFLGRAPGEISRKEINFQDASGLSLDQLRQNIVASPEALGR